MECCVGLNFPALPSSAGLAVSHAVSYLLVVTLSCISIPYLITFTSYLIFVPWVNRLWAPPASTLIDNFSCNFVFHMCILLLRDQEPDIFYPAKRNPIVDRHLAIPLHPLIFFCSWTQHLSSYNRFFSVFINSGFQLSDLAVSFRTFVWHRTGTFSQAPNFSTHSPPISLDHSKLSQLKFSQLNQSFSSISQFHFSHCLLWLPRLTTFIQFLESFPLCFWCIYFSFPSHFSLLRLLKHLLYFTRPTIIVLHRHISVSSLHEQLGLSFPCHTATFVISCHIHFSFPSFLPHFIHLYLSFSILFYFPIKLQRQPWLSKPSILSHISFSPLQYLFNYSCYPTFQITAYFPFSFSLL